jgi:uncharacterized protein involved in exopolysaccharide biosynthesis
MQGLIRRSSAFLSRRRVALALVLGALVLTDLIVTLSCPSTYRAKATVTVESSRLPDDLLPLVPSVQGRIDRLTGLALSEGLLNEIALACPRLARPRILHVFEGGASSPVQTIRDRIEVQASGRGDRSELLSITVTGEKADETAYVASRIAVELVERDRDFRVATATAIHDAVVSEASADLRPLDDLAARIDRMKAENPLMATTQDAGIRAQLEQASHALDEDQITQAEVATSVAMLEGEVSRWSLAVQEEAEVARRAAAAAEAQKAQPRAPADDPRRAHLVELERELVAARSHFTDQNPEVKRLVREIALEREYLGVPDTDGDAEPVPGPGSERSERPAESAPRQEPRVGLVERSSDVKPAADVPTGEPRAMDTRFVIEAPAYRSWREAVAKLEAARTRDAALKARIERRSAELARLRELVDKLPEKRLELVRLEAERDRLHARAEEARQRLERVERIWRIELGDGSGGARTERLALSEAALVPRFALGPDRPWMFFIGLIASVLIAVVAAYVRDAQDRSLHTDEDLQDALDIPVLGVIPRLRGRR